MTGGRGSRPPRVLRAWAPASISTSFALSRILLRRCYSVTTPNTSTHRCLSRSKAGSWTSGPVGPSDVLANGNKFGSSAKWVGVHDRQWSKPFLAAAPLCLAAAAGSAGESLCRSSPGHHDHLLRPWVDEARMALALHLRGGWGAPLSTEFGRWVGYGWMALRLSTRICRPHKSQCGNNAPEGHKRHPLICGMNHKFSETQFDNDRPGTERAARHLGQCE